MATITTRAGKGAPLTNDEVDANFTNLNSDKAETDGATLTNVDINSGSIDGTTIGGASAAAGTFTTVTANHSGGVGLTVDSNSQAIQMGTFGAGTSERPFIRLSNGAGGYNAVIGGTNSTATTNTYFAATAGSVGIGTDSPLTLLDVRGSATFNESGSSIAEFRVESDTRTHMLFVDAATDRVGINTNAPQETMEIRSALLIEGNNSGQSRSTPVTKIVLSDSDTTTDEGQPMGVIQFSTDDTTGSGVNAQISGIATSTSAYGRLIFETGRSGTLSNNLIMDLGESVFNGDAADINFRVESDNNANMLFVDAGNDRVGIGTASPSYRMDVQGTSGASTVILNVQGSQASGNAETVLRISQPADFIGANNEIRSGVTSGQNPYLAFAVRESVTPFATVERMRIESDGDIGLGDVSSSNYSWIRPHTATTGNLIIDADKGATGVGGSSVIFQSRGTERMRLSTTEAVINDLSNDYDFRIESDISTHALFVEGSSGNVGVGTSTPSSDGGVTLEIYNAATPTLKLNDGDEYAALFQLRGNDLEVRGSSGNFEVYTGAADGASSTERLRITSGGNTIFNNGQNDCDFRVASTNKTNMLFVDAGNDAVGIGGTPLASNVLTVTGGSLVVVDGSASANPSSGDVFSQSASQEHIDILTGGWRNAAIINAQTGVTSATRNTEGLYLNSFWGSSTYASASIHADCNTGTGAVYLYTGSGTSAPVERFATYSVETIINDVSADHDFRVESDTNTHMLFVDAGSNAVCIGTSTNSGRSLTIAGSTGASIGITATNAGIYFGDAGTPAGSGGFGLNSAIARAGGTNFHITGSAEGDLCIGAQFNRSILFGTNTSGLLSPRMVINSGGSVGINYTAPATSLDIGGAGIIRFRRSDNSRYGQLYHNNDGTVLESSSVGDNLYLKSVAGNIYIQPAAGTTNGTVINDNSVDADFRVESDANSSMLVVDAGTNSVNIAGPTPTSGIVLNTVGIQRNYATNAQYSGASSVGQSIVLAVSDPGTTTTSVWGTTAWNWVTAEVTVYIGTSGGSYRRTYSGIIYRNTTEVVNVVNESSAFQLTSGTPSAGKFGIAFRESSGGVGPTYNGNPVKTDFVIYNNTGQTLLTVYITIKVIGAS